jgi:hypothetical protein
VFPLLLPLLGWSSLPARAACTAAAAGSDAAAAAAAAAAGSDAAGCSSSSLLLSLAPLMLSSSSSPEDASNRPPPSPAAAAAVGHKGLALAAVAASRCRCVECRQRHTQDGMQACSALANCNNKRANLRHKSTIIAPAVVECTHCVAELTPLLEAAARQCWAPAVRHGRVPVGPAHRGPAQTRTLAQSWWGAAAGPGGLAQLRAGQQHGA